MISNLQKAKAQSLCRLVIQVFNWSIPSSSFRSKASRLFGLRLLWPFVRQSDDLKDLSWSYWAVKFFIWIALSTRKLQEKKSEYIRKPRCKGRQRNRPGFASCLPREAPSEWGTPLFFSYHRSIPSSNEFRVPILRGPSSTFQTLTQLYFVSQVVKIEIFTWSYYSTVFVPRLLSCRLAQFTSFRNGDEITHIVKYRIIFGALQRV